MRKGTIRLIVVLMAVAMVGLISLQVYWINSAIKQNDRKFRQHVYEAMRDIVSRLERQEVTSYIVGHFDTARDQDRIVITGNFDSVMNLLPRIQQALMQPDFPHDPDYSANHFTIEDSMMLGDHKIKVSWDIENINGQGDFEDFDPFFEPSPFDFMDSLHDIQSQINNEFRRFAKRSLLVSNIVDQLYASKRDPAFRINLENLNRIIRSELENHGIKLDYVYGIVDRNISRIMYTNLHEGSGHDLLNSEFAVRLFPNDLFPSSEFLTLHFPSQTGFLLKQIWFTLSSSIILVLLIVFSFYYALWTIIRQKKTSDIKNDFINNMTHEFKTPIATVSLACEALQDPGINKNTVFFQRYVDVIKNENERLGWQVEKVLQMATVDKQDYKLKLEKTNVHEIINTVLDNFRMLIEKRGGSLHKSLNAKNYSLSTDQGHFTNILNNLLDNANKYSPDKPEITVETSNYNEHLMISISDKGIGMSKDVLNKIFEKFYRVPTGNIHDVKGFGLGLSYVKTMSMALGAGIDVRSQPGKGSTFMLSFPLNNE